MVSASTPQKIITSQIQILLTCHCVLPPTCKGRRERREGMNVIEIWQPRYKDNTVLIATYKVKQGYNYVRFTKAKHLEGMLFRFHSTDINTNNVQRNGKALMYILPFDKLENITEEETTPVQKHEIKLTIDGKEQEFTDIDGLIKGLSQYLGKEVNVK